MHLRLATRGKINTFNSFEDETSIYKRHRASQCCQTFQFLWGWNLESEKKETSTFSQLFLSIPLRMKLKTPT